MKQKDYPYISAVFALGIVMILLGGGCASTAKFDYPRAPGVMYRSTSSQPLPPITVVPFYDVRTTKVVERLIPEEQRVNVGSDMLKGVQGNFAIGWLPLMPYAWMSAEIPEDEAITLATLKNFWCKFDRELAEAATESLKVSGCFKEVHFEDSAENAKSRYLFKAFVHSTKYEGIRLTYGLSYLVAPVLWIIGAPNAISQNTLEITFYIMDTQEKKVIWQYRFNGTRKLTHFLYHNIGNDTANYSLLMKTAMNAALYDLEKQVKEAQK